MNSSTLTTLLGIAQAAGTAGVAAYATASEDGTVNVKSPIFWLGIGIAILMAVKAYFTQGSAPPGQVMVTKQDPTVPPPVPAPKG